MKGKILCPAGCQNPVARITEAKEILRNPRSAGSWRPSGYSVIVKGGLSEDDLIAFPYGKDVKEGAKTKEVTLDQMYGY